MLRKHFLCLAAFALIASFLVVACAPAATPFPTSTPAPITFTDGLGRAITLASPAQRIVSMAPSNTEILYAIGAGAQMAGRDEFSDYPPEAKSLPTVGGSFGGYNNEAILQLNPDLVLAAEINTPEQVKALEDLGVTVFYLSNPKDMESMYQNLLTVAQMTGHELEARLLVEKLRKRVSAVTEKIQDLSDQPTVFYEMDATDPNAPFTAGSGTFVDMLISMAGGKNVGNVLSSPWAAISSEELVVQNPNIILLGDAAYGVTPESVAQRAGWEGIDAVKNSHIYAFDDNLVSRPGPRLVDGLEALAKILHPDLFE